MKVNKQLMIKGRQKEKKLQNMSNIELSIRILILKTLLFVIKKVYK